jgi:ABC-type polysaccharide/polyol phosphate export permease
MITYLSGIWKCRYFWMSLVRTDLRTRYRRSLLGLGWSLLQPLVMACILFLVFQHVFQQRSGDYFPHLLTGLVGWNFIFYCAILGCQCFIHGEAYIRQCPLPLAIYPLRTAIGGLFHLAMGLVVVAVVFTATHRTPGVVALLSLIPTMLLLFLFCWSLAVLCGSANVFFQDTQHLTEVCFQILFYLSPIIWRPEDLTGKWIGWVLQWNPVVPLLHLLRQPLMHGVAPSAGEYLHALAIVAFAAGVASWLLSRLQTRLIFHL